MNYTNVIQQKDAIALIGNKDVIFVDCRFRLDDTAAGQNAYLEGHIPGAVYAHLDNDLSGEIIPNETGRHPLPSIKKFERVVRSWGLNENSQVVVYDYGHGGVAARLWWMLRYWNHSKVAVLDGGWRHWAEHGAPISSEINTLEYSDWKATKVGDWVVNHDAIYANLQSGKYCLVDARTTNRYAGKEEPIDRIAGHVPGALSFPFIENLDTKLRWKSREEIRSRFQTLSEENGEVVIYCGSGVTACHNLLALEYADLPSAKLYPGSWSDWITHEGYPIE